MKLISALLLLALSPAMASETALPTATVLIHPEEPGAVISSDFVGLSTEKKILTRDCFSPKNTTLINLCRTLGSGVLRIGANGVDSTFFQRESPPVLESMKDNRYVIEPRTIGPATIDAFFGFARAAGWKVIYGVNMGANDPAMAAEESDYALNVGGREVLAIEIGNEPNLYPQGPNRAGIRPGNWGYPQYKAEFETNVEAILQRNPKAPITGPALTKSTQWMPLFMNDFKDRIVLATSHVYPLSAKETDPQSQRFTSVEKLLSAKYDEDWLPKLENAKAAGVPYRVGECNTASSGGKRGVSDAFASALWAIDFMFDVARHGGAGVNLHGSFTPHNYSSIVYDKQTETYAPAPLYYGLLFFSRAAQGRMITSECKASTNLVAHAVTGNDGRLRVSLVNKDFTQGVNVQLEGGTKAKKGEVLRLSAPDAAATSGVTFGGSAVELDGTWAPKTTEAIVVTGGKATVTLSPASAALVIFE